MSASNRPAPVNFKQKAASFDENTKRIAESLEAFVVSSVKEDERKKLAAWEKLIDAIDERLDHRIQYLMNKLLSGKELESRIRQYDYKQNDSRVVL